MDNQEPRPAAVNFTKAIDLDKQIEVVEETDSQGLVLFRFVAFKLEKDAVNKILKARSQGEKLHLRGDLLEDLRTCALSEGHHQTGGNRQQSGMTFCTYYHRKGDAKHSDLILMRSVISLDGDIINQVRKECLNNPQKSLAIATAHHWLIAQITSQIGVKAVSYKHLQQKAWIAAIAIAVVAAILALINIIPWWLSLAIAIVAAAIAWFLPRQRSVRRSEWTKWLQAFLSPAPTDRDRAQRIWRNLVR